VKKFILIFILFLIIIFGVSIKVYHTAVKSVNKAENKSISLAKNSSALSEVDDFHIYNGIDTVNVIEGKNKQGKKLIVWIPEKSKKVIVKKASSGLSKQQAVDKLLQEKKPKEIISVRLGMEKNIPLWEIYYRSDNNLINYYYIDFETGEWLKKIENL